MPKGKTNQPLTILVDTTMLEEAEVQALVEQGHTVYPIHTATVNTEYDGILSRKAWKYDPEYLDIALKSMRKEKKGDPKS